MVRNIASENLQTDCAVHNVPMDGNCLFTSLALQLDRPAAASRDIRTEVVQYLESHTEMVSLWYSQRFSRRLYGVLIITSAKGVMFSPAFHRMFVEL